MAGWSVEVPLMLTNTPEEIKEQPAGFFTGQERIYLRFLSLFFYLSPGIAPKGISMKRHITIIAAVFSILGIAAARTPVDSTRVAVLLAEGDRLTDMFENQGALDRYREAFRLDSTNVEVLWRISRAYIDLGEHLPVETEVEQAEQLRVYEVSLAYAERAVRANPRHSMAFTRRAIAKGRIALFKGIWESLDLVKQTRADVDTALILDQNNDVANYIMGRVHAKVTERPRIFRWPLGLGWANNDDAIRYYEKAIALKPDFIMYRLDCARTYVEEDSYEKARGHLRAIETLSNKDEDDERFREEARILLREIKGKK